MIRFFVINLESRKDRLETFFRNNLSKLHQQVEVIKAIDGNKIEYNRDLIKKINPFDYLALPHELKGVIGCCQSHFSVLEKIVENYEYGLVMEDDLILLEDLNHPQIRNSIQTFIKIKGDLLYFNYPYPKENHKKSNNGYILKPKDKNLYTAEMYLISKKMARDILDNFSNNLGAFDLILNKIMMKNPEYKIFILDNPIADQVDRKDSNIR